MKARRIRAIVLNTFIIFQKSNFTRQDCLSWTLMKYIQKKVSLESNSSWAISNPERWCCESAALTMPAHLENSAVATGLEKVSFHSNPKER